MAAVSSNALPSDLVQDARLLRTKGASLSQIAKQLGISKSSAWEITKGIAPQLAQKTQAPIESLEDTDPLNRLETMFGTPKPKALINYERLLRSQGSERSSRIRSIVEDAIETRIYLDVLGIDLARNPSHDNGQQLSFDNILKWRLLNQGSEGKAESKIFDLYIDTQSRLYDILLKRTEGRDITSEVASLKQTLEAVQTVVAMLPKKESGVWAKAFEKLIDKVAPEVKTFLSGVGDFLSQQKSGSQPPPPSTMPPNEVELAERTGITEQLPKLQQPSETTFAEAEGLPEEETESTSEPSETSGGSTSEVEKRLKRRVEK